MRVYEYAKKYNLSSKEVLKHLSDGGFDVANHMAQLADEQIAYLDQKNKPANSQQSVKNPALKPSKEPTLHEHSIEQQASTPAHIIILESMTAADFAKRVNVPVNEIILTLLRWGIVSPKNQLLDESVVLRLAQHLQVEAKRPERIAEQKRELLLSANSDMQSRLPVIVVIGHVDHGKTTLLDFIRKTRVAAREKGGITQHLGAYHVDTKHGGIIFLDTPGHEAFSKIRARGLKVADIAVLVIAADDGIMPQTIEAIKFAKELEVPIIVAINKIDKVDPMRLEVVKRQLAEQDLLPEEWGGQTVLVPVSAKLGTGVDSLLEMIDLQAQLLELETDVSGFARGYVLESKIQKGRGAVATVLLQQGKLQVGDHFMAGEVSGKVSSIVDSYGKMLKEVGPSIPVQIAGFSELPNAGDFFEVAPKGQLRKAQTPVKVAPRMSSKGKAINLIIKADTNSSIEALQDAIRKLSKKIDHVAFNIVSSGVGDINERDVVLASHTNASIIGLHVKAANAMQMAQKESVAITLFDIIYKLLEELEQRAEALKEVKMIDKKVGDGIIRKVFDIKKIGIIAGCYVQDGIFSNKGKMVVYRGRQKIGEGKVTSLQRDGKSVKEVHAGFECAFMASGLIDFQTDDRVECYISVPENKA